MAAISDEELTNQRSSDTRPTKPVIGGHYEIDLEAPIGSGGMAVVYRGRDLKTRRPVALRTLRVEYRNDPASRARFRREARTMAFIKHENVARVYDLWEDSNASWAVMEYVPGKSLKSLLAERDHLSIEEVAAILHQVASALDQIHGHGMVHLDVKPHNLIQTPDGVIKLIDFGLAQRSDQPQEMIGGIAFGTAAYLSPEQASGKPVSPASDIYSLGCVVYEMLTGAPPFGGLSQSGSSSRVIQAQIEEIPLPPSKARPDLAIPQWVDDLVLWSLSKKPDERFGDATTLAELFQAGIEGSIVARTQAEQSARPSAIIETHADDIDEPRGPSVIRRSYRAGGRKLRSASRLRRQLWRFVIAFAFANLVLAAMLYFDRGSIPGIYNGSAVLESGAEAVVTISGLNFRTSPGIDATSILTLDLGMSVTLTGPVIERGGERWWPAAIQYDGERLDGYLWEGGIEPVGETGRTQLERRFRELIDRIEDRVLVTIAVSHLVQRPAAPADHSSS
jgi:serine/threonine protein kinase